MSTAVIFVGLILLLPLFIIRADNLRYRREREAHRLIDETRQKIASGIHPN